MDREAERNAFTRAYAYLNYDAPAKWTALVAAVGTGLLFVALLGLLWLFADLVVYRGTIPSFAELGPNEKAVFQKKWLDQDKGESLKSLGLAGPSDRFEELTTAEARQPLPQEEETLWRAHLYTFLRDKVNGTAGAQALPAFRDLAGPEQDFVIHEWQALPDKETLLDKLDLSAPRKADLVKADRSALSPADQETLWQAYLFQKLASSQAEQDRVAAEVVRQRLETARDSEPPIQPSLADHGIIGLLTRTYIHDRFHAPAVVATISWFARWNSWMWRNTGFRGANFPTYLAGLLTVALLLTLFRTLLSFLQREMAARAVIEATTRLRRAVYHHTFRLGTLAFKELGPSEAVSIFTRHVEAVHDALFAWLTVMVSEPVKFVLLLLFALIVNPWLALAFLLFAALIWLVGGQVAAYYRGKARQLTNRASEQLTLIRETLMFMRLVKVYLMELFNQARVERLLSRYARAQASRYRGEAIYHPLLIFLGTLAALVLLYVAGLIVLYGQLGVASAIALATALICLYWPMESWLANRKYIRRGREAAVVLFRFLDRPGEVGQVVGAEFLPPLARQLEFDNVSLREPGTGRPLLQGVSFTIKQGQRVGLVGAEDQEKHALVYLIPRLLDPASGEIRIDQYNLRWVTLDSLRAQIGIVLQHNLVFHDTVANNIGCGDPAFNLPQIIEAAKIAHAHHFIQKLPQGYDTTIGELGHSLNVSEKFRIALARAILRDPALLIVEEPDVEMDDESKSLVDDTFTRLLPGRTALFLPHRISTIRSCDHILLLNKGRIEASGVHRDLLGQNPLYRHLHYLEFNVIGD
ncbi:MAG: ABC transporter ATP-binding protein [Gemmataceae bacterium]